jgi:hypothetical protein
MISLQNRQEASIVSEILGGFGFIIVNVIILLKDFKNRSGSSHGHDGQNSTWRGVNHGRLENKLCNFERLSVIGKIHRSFLSAEDPNAPLEI